MPLELLNRPTILASNMPPGKPAPDAPEGDEEEEEGEAK
jgi:hypothetical protein